VKLNTRTYKDEAVAISSLALLPIKAANSTIVCQHHCIPVWVSKMQAKKSLRLRWHSFLGGSSDILTSVFLRMAANIMIMGVCCCSALQLSMMQDQKSLTLCWHSFLGGGSDIVAALCAHEGGQYCDYGFMLTHSTVNVQDEWPEIRDVPLTLISRMGQRACRLPFTSNAGQYFLSRLVWQCNPVIAEKIRL